MDELRFDIIKHSYHKIIWYSIFFSIIFFLVLILYSITDHFINIISDEYKTPEIATLIILAIVIIFTFKFLPNILNTKFRKLGSIRFDNSGFEIKTNSIITVSIAEVKCCKLIINSYEGQSITGASKPFLDILNKPSNPGLPTADGLRNFIIFEKSSKSYKMEFYIGREDFYNHLIDLGNDWKRDYKMELVIIR
jgi:hypothetical protein